MAGVSLSKEAEAIVLWIPFETNIARWSLFADLGELTEFIPRPKLQKFIIEGF